jgi:hypothetical protein
VFAVGKVELGQCLGFVSVQIGLDPLLPPSADFFQIVADGLL